MEITEQYLDEVEKKIKELKRALRKKSGLNGKITVDIPFVNKQLDYTITQADRDAINQEISEKETALKDKFKEVTEAKL